MVHIYSGITQPLKEWNNAICSNIDGSRDCHTEWSKSNRKGKLSYEISYMWNLKRNATKKRRKEKTQMNLITKQNSQT